MANIDVFVARRQAVHQLRAWGGKQCVHLGKSGISATKNWNTIHCRLAWWKCFKMLNDFHRKVASPKNLNQRYSFKTNIWLWRDPASLLGHWQRFANASTNPIFDTRIIFFVTNFRFLLVQTKQSLLCIFKRLSYDILLIRGEQENQQIFCTNFISIHSLRIVLISRLNWQNHWLFSHFLQFDWKFLRISPRVSLSTNFKICPRRCWISCSNTLTILTASVETICVSLLTNFNESFALGRSSANKAFKPTVSPTSSRPPVDPSIAGSPLIA